MGEGLPKDLQDYMTRKIASGEFTSEDDVIAAGLRSLQDQEMKLAELRELLDVAIGDANEGRFSSRTVSDIIAQTKADLKGK